MRIEKELKAWKRFEDRMHQPDALAIRASRKEAGLKIDPETAERGRFHVQFGDPYGICPDVPEECSQVGRESFVRSPGGPWVHFDDLPESVQLSLEHKSKARVPRRRLTI